MMRSMFLAATMAGFSLSVASASIEGRSYDSAVNCKALSLLAKNVGDARSKIALTAIDAEIEKKITVGKTRDQTKADVEYSRFEWVDTTGDKAVFDAEWTKCVARWAAN